MTPPDNMLKAAEEAEERRAAEEAEEWMATQDTYEVEKSCKNCGQPVKVQMVRLKTERMQEAMERMPVICDDCAKREEEAEEEQARITEREAYLDRVKASQIDRNLIGLTFEGMERKPQQDEALPDVRRWANGEIQGLILSGEVGTGKSYLAAIAANARLLREPLDWVRVSKLILQARAGFKNPARDQVTKLLLNGGKTLIIDDIDKAKPTDFVLEILFEAIDSRCTNGAGLLVTTNLSYNELTDQIGEAIASRLVGYCEGHRIEGEDLRTGRPRPERTEPQDRAA